ncbi:MULTISPECIES: OmpA family protein [Segatella]|jgi:outer membrane protein OmpA-like peptidoglycan-associated protein|uniref:Immunogenic 23 kDa lipoprotein PG3 n=2 Tax=Segatella TaxID=2974251 RepID=D8DWB4_9BACT|nr:MULTISPECIES: OmpA family protein [Segatella]MBQ3857818.1 OmpA family protein [Prevotella sp.]EFI72174.1 immunogenic 23 kDa lipoprotein PG3 [Segatella baroniae B14]MDR4930843.1 OmpA family protein [Segatella bryantii]MEE3416131.1 OmpA family protein [Prevotella sp.]OYP53402.1 OmpA family protein [Segatella bryantii]
MRKMKITVVALAALLTVSSCGTSQGTGTGIGAGAGAVLGGLIGGLANNSHHGTGAVVGAAIGAAVGGLAGNRIGAHMDKKKAEIAQQVSNAKVEEVTDANGLKAIKVTFDSGLQFDLGKSTLKSAAKNDLAKFASTLKNDPMLAVDIQGYTDATGGDAINLPLSDKRAKAVSSYLVSQGVSSSQFKNVAGYASANPIVNATVAPENRRVEVYLYASDKMVKSAENGTLE